jgi:hypothetical protein
LAVISTLPQALAQVTPESGPVLRPTSAHG